MPQFALHLQFKHNMCMQACVLVNVSLTSCVVWRSTWWGRACQFSFPKDLVVHIGRKFYLPKWLATGKVSTSRSEVFLTHISSWEFLMLTKVQYAVCLIFCFIYQGKETTVWVRSIYSKSYFRLKVNMLVLVVCCLNLWRFYILAAISWKQ